MPVILRSSSTVEDTCPGIVDVGAVTSGVEDCWRATASIFEDVGAVEDYWMGIITVVSPMTIIIEDVRAALVLCVQQISFASG